MKCPYCGNTLSLRVDVESLLSCKHNIDTDDIIFPDPLPEPPMHVLCERPLKPLVVKSIEGTEGCFKLGDDLG